MRTEPGTDVYVVMVNKVDPNMGGGVNQYIGSFSSWWDSWATNEQQQDTYRKSFHEMTWEKAILRCIEEVQKRNIEDVEGQWDKGYNMAVLNISQALKRLLER